jgi:hypothetical protein
MRSQQVTVHLAGEHGIVVVTLPHQGRSAPVTGSVAQPRFAAASRLSDYSRRRALSSTSIESGLGLT